VVWHKGLAFILKQGIHLSVHCLAPLGIFRSLRETCGFDRSGSQVRHETGRHEIPGG